MTKAIVLSANNSYLTPLTTVIKSIMTYHRGIKFYILNEDLPQEWFLLLNQQLKKLDSFALNIKLDADKVNSLKFQNFFL